MAILFLFPLAPSQGAQEYVQRKDYSFNCGSKPSLYFDLFGDSVDISVGQESGISIKAVKAVKAPSMGAAQIRFDHLQCEVVQVKDIIYVKGVRVPLNTRKVKRSIWDRILRIFEAIDDTPAVIRYSVTLPRSTRVKMTGDADKIVVSGLNSGILIQARCNEVTVSDNRCPANISGQIGKLRVSDHQGTLELRGGGEALLSGIRGTLNLNWKSGKVVATGIEGAVSATGDSTQFLLDRCQGAVTLKVQDGGVRITGHSGKDVKVSTGTAGIFLDTLIRNNKITLDTQSGDVELAVRKGTQGMFDFDTGERVPMDLQALEMNITEMTPSNLRGWVGSRDGAQVRINVKEGRFRTVSLD